MCTKLKIICNLHLSLYFTLLDYILKNIEYMLELYDEQDILYKKLVKQTDK